MVMGEDAVEVVRVPRVGPVLDKGMSEGGLDGQRKNSPSTYYVASEGAGGARVGLSRFSELSMNVGSGDVGCAGVGEELFGKEDESGQGENVADDFADEVDRRPSGGVHVGRRGAGEGCAKCGSKR